MSRTNLTAFSEFLSEPRSALEIAKHLGQPNLTEDRIRQLTLKDGEALFEQKDVFGRSVFVKAKPSFERPDWYARTNADGQPYIWIQFKGLDADRIKIIPISDVHYGAEEHNTKRFRKYLDWIASEPSVFACLNGDIINNSIDGSIGGAVYEDAFPPHIQIWGNQDRSEPGIIELLRPIAHKLLWAQPGNHEWRTWKKTNIDPTRIICEQLNIPYFSEPVYADILSWGKLFTFYCHHGNGGGGTKGGKITSAMRPADFQEAINFIIMGHVHDSMTTPVTRIARDREYKNGKLVRCELKEQSQYTVICPAFLEYFRGYGSRAGYAPGSWGTVACTLYNDGTYRSSE
jgi:hypothetical protein